MDKNMPLSLAQFSSEREGLEIAEHVARATGARRVDLSTWNPTLLRASISRSAVEFSEIPVVVLVRDESGALGCVELWVAGIDLDEALTRDVETYLRRAAALARRAELNAFFNGILHDLRTPLRHVCAIAALFGENEIDRPKLEAAMSKEVRDLEKLLKMGQYFADAYGSYENLSCSLQSAWQRTVYEHECECSDCEGSLHAVIPPSLHVGLSEPDLCRVFAELIDNSHKFGTGSPCIFLRAEASFGGGVSIRYWDQSGGLEVPYASKVFQPFFRGHRGPREGQGLGLFLCREIIRLAGGKIELATAEAHGAETQPTGLIFDIWLPGA